MCGIAGMITTSHLAEAVEIEKAIKSMLSIQAYRGPDDEGVWLTCSDGTCIGVGHRRLAIIDLSKAGYQPMVSACGKYVLAYNGEIYNYIELRKQLISKGIIFKTNTDTEVLFQALICFGEKAFEYLNGMWALVFIDLNKRIILFSRDRFGEKPLYYYQNRWGLYFASEIKAICEGSGDSFVPNATVVGRFLGQSLLNSQDDTFFEGIQRFPAASCSVGKLSGEHGIKLSPPKFFWSCPRVGAMDVQADDLAREVRDVFMNSVRIRLRSDVPVGVLLSGGLDSSAIAAAMVHCNPGSSLNILSAVSDDSKYNEAPYIDIVSKHLGQRVYKVRLNPRPEEAFASMNRAIWYNDEPVGSFSTVAHLLLMEKARDIGITVILSGQGGDELLCGYLKYYGFYLRALMGSLRFVKAGKVLLDILKRPSGYVSDFKLSDAKRYLPFVIQRDDERVFGEVLQNLNWRHDIGLGGGTVQERQSLDMERFSVPSLTHYEDRMSMACSREIRLPFLDHRMAELLIPLEPELKLNNGWTKWIFRKAMSGWLPKSIIWRSDKKGFSNPVSEWLRNEWRDRITAILSKKMRTEELGLINRKELQSLYLHYCKDKNPWLSEKDIFNPLSLELWARQYEKYLA